MKNLKLFVFALCAILLSVVTVNAAECNLPNGPYTDLPACEASLDGTGYKNHGHAFAQFDAKGGDLVYYTNVSWVAYTVKHNGSVTMAKDANGNDTVLTLTGITTINKGVNFTVKDSAIKNPRYIVNEGATLTLNNVEGSNMVELLDNSGTTNINGGKYTTNLQNGDFITNKAKAVLNVSGTTIVANALKADVLKNSGVATLTDLDVNTTGNLVTVADHGSTTTLNGKNNVDANAVVKTALTGVPASHGGVAAVVNVNGGTYKTTGTAFYANYGMNLNVAGGTVVSKDRGLNLYDATAVISGGSIESTTATVATTGTGKGNLTVTGGILKSATSYPLHFYNSNITYAISGGTFEAEVEDRPAIMIDNLGVTTKDGVTTIAKAYTGILTGGKYLNNIIKNVVTDNRGATIEITNLLVAKGYTVKSEDPYKVVVSTKASDETSKPGANKPGTEQAPNTFDAGLVYMGLALSAIGASVVSVRKLRNN